jgi:CubicO group peptidase (beta-lactamase class C family)
MPDSTCETVQKEFDLVDQLMIRGVCDERFSRVRDAFAANFENGEEVGASFAVTVNGESVVDLWAGHADAGLTRPWERDTVVHMWSASKAVTAICAHMLVDRGLLDVDAPVARYWPEFAQAGKENIPVRYLLSHQAGLSVIEEPLPAEAFYDWDRMTSALAAQKPLWEPGTIPGYQAITFGYLVGEVVRRITGKSLGTFVREEIAGPLGADFHIGLSEEHHARVAEIVPYESPQPWEVPSDDTASDLQFKLRQLSGNPPITADLANTQPWRAAEIPAANGHGNARSVARIMSALACGGEVDGVRLLRESTIANAIEEQTYGHDLILGKPFRWGLGYMLVSQGVPLSPNPRAFGHGGWGGALAVADLDARVSWAYMMNRMVARDGSDNPEGVVSIDGDIRAGLIGKALNDSLR